MMLKRALGIILMAASAHSAAAVISVAATDPLNADVVEAARAGSSANSDIWAAPPARPPVQVVTVPPAPLPSAERVPSANPLWGVPLSALSGTRDRPIFSASRKPIPPAVPPSAIPEPVVVAKPSEPERPQLSLIGTVASEDEGFGIFLDQSNAALRLKIGEDHEGWKLRSVQGREAVLEKDQQFVTLALPQPGPALSAGEVRSEFRQPPAANAGNLASQSRRDRSGR
jgi:general secretion pathway protein N